MTLQPFWNKHTGAISKKLFLPKNGNTIELKLDDNKKNSCINNREVTFFNKKTEDYDKRKTKDSWLNIRVQKHKDPNDVPKNKKYLYNVLNNVDIEETTIPDCKARKMRIYPNEEEEEKLRRWFGCYRYVYNSALAFLNEEWKQELQQRILDKASGLNVDKEKKKRYESDYKLTRRLIGLFAQDSVYEDKPWMILLSDTRDRAIDELIKNRRTNLNKGTGFHLHFKKKKRESISIYIRGHQFKQKSDRGKYKFLRFIRRTQRNEDDPKISKTDIPNFTNDLELHYDRFGHYYLIFKVDVQRDDSKVPKRIISIDPGVRTFLTGYTNDGYIYHLGENNVSRLASLNTRRNRITSLLDPKNEKVKHFMRSRRRCHLRQSYRRVSEKIYNLVEDAHKKISTWLLKNFEYIILPRLDTNSLCRQKKISKKVKNNIKSWRHCSFIDRLKFKMCEYPDRKLIIPMEDYTSKTCTACGTISNPGRSKVFKCSNVKCKFIIDRDSNGARNILLKLLTLHTSQPA
jgi:transposase